MFAVIRTGGKQYRVSPGDLLIVEKLDGDPGAELSFDQVLMMGEGEQVAVGAPAVAGALVRATLVETRKGEKIKVFKKIRRKGYRRTQGHRQWESVLRVTGIEGSGQSAKWDGEVNLTPRSVLTARARGMKAEVRSDAAPTAAPKAMAAKTAAPAPKAVSRKKAAKLEGALVEQPISETPAEAPQTIAKPEAQAGEGAQAGTDTKSKPAKPAAAKKSAAKVAAPKKAAPKAAASKKTAAKTAKPAPKSGGKA